jgi:hypothetical protein
MARKFILVGLIFNKIKVNIAEIIPPNMVGIISHTEEKYSSVESVSRRDLSVNIKIMDGL